MYHAETLILNFTTIKFWNYSYVEQCRLFPGSLDEEGLSRDSLTLEIVLLDDKYGPDLRAIFYDVRMLNLAAHRYPFRLEGGLEIISIQGYQWEYRRYRVSSRENDYLSLVCRKCEFWLSETESD